MENVDSKPEMPPNFDSLPSSSDVTDSDKESDDGQCSCPECLPESSDNEDIPREKKPWVLLVLKKNRRLIQHESNPIQEELWD